MICIRSIDPNNSCEYNVMWMHSVDHGYFRMHSIYNAQFMGISDSESTFLQEGIADGRR